MKRFFLLILAHVNAASIYAQADTVQKIVEGRMNSPEQQQKPYVILISADGFRYDYAEKYQAATLLKLSNEGVRADYMIPGFPTLTFPNHYSLVTGLYPAHHGIVNNHFYDPMRQESFSMRINNTVRDGSWYGGIPLWVLAEQQQMLTACFYWIGSEANIQGIRPTYYYNYNEEIPMNLRIEIVLDWLRLPPEKRPHLINFYIVDTDNAGHNYGPDAKETGESVRSLDSSIKKLTEAVKTTGLPVNFIFLSDHGMINIDTVNTIAMPAILDTSRFIIPRGSEIIELYAKEKKDILPTYRKLKKTANGYKVYLKSGLPGYLRYSSKDDRMNRIGDLVLLPNWPKVFNFSNRRPKPGAHGFDPYKIKEMGAVFYAWGPNLKNRIKLPPFENVQVYPVVTKILGLRYSHKIDGTDQLAKKIVK